MSLGARSGSRSGATPCVERARTVLKGLEQNAPTCRSLISAGQRVFGTIVHTEGVLEPTSTALNCSKPQVNGAEQTRTAITAQGERLALREQTTRPDLVAPNARSCR